MTVHELVLLLAKCEPNKPIQAIMIDDLDEKRHVKIISVKEESDLVIIEGVEI